MGVPVPDTDLLNLLSCLSELPSPSMSFICNEGQEVKKKGGIDQRLGGHKLVIHRSNFTQTFFWLTEHFKDLTLDCHWVGQAPTT